METSDDWQGDEAVGTARTLIVGARRMADAVALPGQDVLYEYRSAKIAEYIKKHPEYEKVVIALSGDVGFYSGAKGLLKAFGRKCRNHLRYIFCCLFYVEDWSFLG